MIEVEIEIFFEEIKYLSQFNMVDELDGIFNDNEGEEDEEDDVNDNDDCQIQRVKDDDEDDNDEQLWKIKQVIKLNLEMKVLVRVGQFNEIMKLNSERVGVVYQFLIKVF